MDSRVDERLIKECEDRRECGGRGVLPAPILVAWHKVSSVVSSVSPVGGVSHWLTKPAGIVPHAGNALHAVPPAVAKRIWDQASESGVAR